MSTLLTSSAKSMFLRTLERLRGGSLELIVDGRTWEFGEPGGSLRATVVVHRDRFFQRALFGGNVALGEAWMDGDWSSPDLVAVVRLAVRNLAPLEQQNRLLSALSRGWDALRHRMRGNSVAGSRRNIQAHYDLSNDFFRLFLDRSMMYSCACYEAEDSSLEAAQFHKLDTICRKLRLGPEDHVLEIGTGWGGFAEHAARHYGCRVTTTTISRRQYEYARERFDSIPERERIELLEEDYRNLRGQYDKIVSIEMFEAVGLRYYDEFFRACDRLLRPDGSMLMQTITINEQAFPGLPPAQRLDPEVHLSGIGTGLGERDSPLAGARDFSRAVPRGGHRHALRTHAGRVAETVSPRDRRGPRAGLRRSLYSHVGLLPGLLRGRVSGAPHRRLPIAANQNSFTPEVVWRALGRGRRRY